MPSIKLVNRGAAGLLSKAPKKEGEVGQAQASPTFLDSLFNRWPDARKAKIDPALRAKKLVVPIASLTPDPLNARRHNERNLQAVQESLAAYGQRSLLTVRKCKQGLIVMKGNGTLRAAIEMGWTEIAATVQEMTDAEAAGYGVADNRTAELATWDFATLSVLEKLAAEADLPLAGWSAEEVEAIRIGSFVEPPEDFPEVDENIETEHVCPKCGYAFSGGTVQAVGSNGEAE